MKKEFSFLTSEEDWIKALPHLEQLRTELDKSKILEIRPSLLERGYKLIALLVNDKLVTVGSYILHPHISRENEFWVHELVTIENERSKGYGTMMLKYLEKLAKESGCSRLMIHTRAHRTGAKNFYLNHVNYKEYGTVFEKKLS